MELVPDSPPNTPSESNLPDGARNQSAAHSCCSVPVSSLDSINALTDRMGVSPLYKQLDFARWSSAAQVYRMSRTVSRTESPTPDSPPSFTKSESAGHLRYLHVNSTTSTRSRTPLFLEEIGLMNRRRNGKGETCNDDGPLQLEAISTINELALEVLDISVSDMLPRTADLLFVNVKTQEGDSYTLELTMKGWRVASCRHDCMHGDHMKVDLHIQYYRNARELLNDISPNHYMRFNECVAKKLELWADKQESSVIAAT